MYIVYYNESCTNQRTYFVITEEFFSQYQHLMKLCCVLTHFIQTLFFLNKLNISINDGIFLSIDFLYDGYNKIPKIL